MYQKHSQTSKAAYLKRDKSLLDKAYALIKISQKRGMTGDEIAAALQIPIGTASARIAELMDKNLIEKTDKTRPTRSGRYGYVHVVMQ